MSNDVYLSDGDRQNINELRYSLDTLVGVVETLTKTIEEFTKAMIAGHEKEF